MQRRAMAKALHFKLTPLILQVDHSRKASHITIGGFGGAAASTH